MTNDLDELTAEVARLYPAVYRRFHLEHRQKPFGTDITPRMLWILQHVTAVGPSTLGELVDRLEAKGHVGRMRDGTLHDFEERFERKMQWSLRRNGMECTEAGAHGRLRWAAKHAAPRAGERGTVTSRRCSSRPS